MDDETPIRVESCRGLVSGSDSIRWTIFSLNFGEYTDASSAPAAGSGRGDNYADTGGLYVIVEHMLPGGTAVAVGSFSANAKWQKEVEDALVEHWGGREEAPWGAVVEEGLVDEESAWEWCEQAHPDDQYWSEWHRQRRGGEEEEA